MIIHHLGDSTFSIKTKLSEIVTGPESRIGTITLSGPGEYEIADIQVRGYQDAYLFSAEGISLLYVNNPGGLSEEVVKTIEGDIDILLLSLDQDSPHLKGALRTMNEIDPKFTLPAVETPDHPFCREIGGCPPPISELKITKKDFIEDERKVVLLQMGSPIRRR
jgi:hypothetical protein